MADFNQEIASEERYTPNAALAEKAHVQSLEQYKALHYESITDPETFWKKMGANLSWSKPFTKAFPAYNYDMTKGKVQYTWFEGGKINACYNCLDRHVEAGKGNQVAYFYECNDMDDAHKAFTYQQVLAMVKRIANVLKSWGIQKGDRVALYLPMIAELPASMLACARIGAVHSVIFGGFGADSLSDRFDDAMSRVVLTADGVMRGPKPIHLKKIVDEAIKGCKEVKVTHVLCKKRLGQPEFAGTWTEGRDYWWDPLVNAAEPECPCAEMDAEDPLFMLYTSGSTGKPKGILHTTGGYLMGAFMTFKYTFDYQPNDVFWCTADCGWITGHSYVAYGPMIACATQVIFEGVPTHPDAGRFWQVCEKYSVTQFYTAPTAIRALMRQGEAIVKKYDRSALKILGTVGEPINPAAWHWYNRVVGDMRCPIVDTYWQTETGSHIITPLPGATPTKPGSGTLPMFGVVPAVVDEKGNELEGECTGYLVVKQPFPSQTRTVYGDHERFEKTYFSQFAGYYCTGDGCKRDKDGYYWLTGRIDDVINVSGHRIGTAEVESALVQHPAVSEAAVVGFPHEIKGEGIWAYVSPMEGIPMTDALLQEMKNQVRKVIGAFAQPDVVMWAPALPKTRSGKIMRRILRKLALPTFATEDLGDTSTLLDPNVVEQLKANRPGGSAPPAGGAYPK
jgi:acetyl-CoA synthetase